MPREIKFRAWDKKNLVMRLWDWLLESDYYHQLKLFADENFVWMQFTGLFDKSGKEIYEGDIVKWNDEEYRENQAVVEISINGFRKIEEALYYQARVIGNIYENPELLK